MIGGTVAAVFFLTAVNSPAQQFDSEFKRGPSPRPNANAFPAPASNYGWQRDAIQLMQTQTRSIPSQANNSYAPPVHVPPVVRESHAGLYIPPELRPQSAQDRPAVAQRTPVSTGYPQSIPVHAMPRHAVANGVRDGAMSKYSQANRGSVYGQAKRSGFQQTESPIRRFNRSQLSSESLLKRRGPGLQDRIESLFETSRYLPANSANAGSRVAAVNRSRPQAPQNNMNASSQNIPVPVLARVEAIDPNVGVEMQDELIGELEDSHFQATPIAQHEHEVQPAVANEPVLSDPNEDPFGDRPPLRQAVQHAHERAQDVTAGPGKEVSVLDSPGNHDVSLGADTQYNFEPSHQDLSDELPPGDLVSEQEDQDEFEALPDGPDENRLRQVEQDLNDEINERQIIDPNDPGNSPVAKSCDEFRSRLLNNPLSTISLDVSPPKSSLLTRQMDSRTWRNRRGEEIGKGVMTSLSRGYVILEDGKKLPYARLSDTDLAAIAGYWQIPLECPISNEEYVVRNWIPQTVTWKASALCHKPLFFENIQLERYGHSNGPFLQPVDSTFHFFKSLLFMPYHAALNPPNECQYALGFYRPGDCAPWLKDPIPFSLDGIKVQTLTMLGLAYIP